MARHRSPAARKSRTPAGAVFAAALVGAAIVFGSVLALRGDHKDGATCSGGIALNVTAPSSLSAPLAKVADDFNHTKTKVSGQCVTVKVATRSSAETATALADGWKNAGDGAVPDVWVPESSNWLGLARDSASSQPLAPEKGTTVATSPVVIAAPRPLADALGWPNKQLSWADLTKDATTKDFWSTKGHKEWGAFKLGYADPRSSLSGLMAMLGVTSASQSETVDELSTATFKQNRAAQLAVLQFERNAGTIPATDQDLLDGLRKAESDGRTVDYMSAFPIQESDLIAYNRGVGSGGPPRIQLAASYPGDGLFNQSVVYATLRTASGSPVRAQAAKAFSDAVLAPAGQAALRDAGFRDAQGANPTLTEGQGTRTTLAKASTVDLTGGVLKAAQTTFRAVHQRGTTLALIDGSGSMKDEVPGNPPQTKVQIAIDAALQGLELFAPNDMVGVWEFSTNLPGGVYKELSPTVPLEVKGRYGTHKDDLRQAENTLVPGGDTPLYQAALDAFRSQNSHYKAGRINTVVLLTDGKNDTPDNPNGISLGQLIQTLKREYHPDKPVQIITIAYGPDADPSALQQISNVTHARSYRSTNPRDVLNVFINAVMEASEQ